MRNQLSILAAALLLCAQGVSAAAPFFGIVRLDPSLARIHPNVPIEAFALVRAEVALDACDKVQRVEFNLPSGFRLVREFGPGPIDCAGFVERSLVPLGNLVAGHYRAELGFYVGDQWVASGFPLEFDVVDPVIAVHE